jgi:hypothetical protein
MASEDPDLDGTYVFQLEGTWWANSLPANSEPSGTTHKESGGLFHLPFNKDFRAGSLLPVADQYSTTDLERPAMTGVLHSQYRTQRWPEIGQWPPEAPIAVPSACVPFFAPGGPFAPAYLPNVGFYPFSEIGRFDFFAKGEVLAKIHWNLAGVPAEGFIDFSGKYALEFVGPPPKVVFGPQPFTGGKISLHSNSPGKPIWDYEFLFTNTDTRAEGLLMSIARAPRPATGSGRMIKSA